MTQTIKKIWNWIGCALLCTVICLAGLLAGPRLLGLELYVVLSGSMEPEYKTGSIIYVKETDPDELKVNDVITFHLNGDTIATHRIIEVVESDGEKMYRTKGDANDVEDGSPVPASRVIGTPVFTLPYLGYLVSYIQTTSGRYAAITVGAFILLMVILPDMIFGSESKSKEKTE